MGRTFRASYWNGLIDDINTLRANPPSLYIPPATPPVSYVSGIIRPDTISRCQYGLNDICPWSYTYPSTGFSTPLYSLYETEVLDGISRGWCLTAPYSRSLEMEIRWSGLTSEIVPWNISLFTDDSEWVETEYETWTVGAPGPQYTYYRRKYSSNPGAFYGSPAVGMYKDLTINKTTMPSVYPNFESVYANITLWQPEWYGYTKDIAFSALQHPESGETTLNLYPNQVGNFDGDTWYVGKFEWYYGRLWGFWSTKYDCPGWCGTRRVFT